VVKPTRTKSELEALILEAARALGLDSIVRAVTVRALRREIAGANWILVSMNPTEANYHERQAALRQILPEIREQFDLREFDYRLGGLPQGHGIEVAHTTMPASSADRVAAADSIRAWALCMKRRSRSIVR
jgi:hypothetical protein